MNKHEIKKIMLFFIIIFITMCGVSYIGANQINSVKNLSKCYVEVNGKEVDYKKFNAILEGERTHNKLKEVHQIMYRGNEEKINSTLFTKFPNVEKIDIRNCLLESNLKIGSHMKHLKGLFFTDCIFGENIEINSNSICELGFEDSKLSNSIFNLSKVKTVSLLEMNVSKQTIEKFENLHTIKELSLVKSKIENIGALSNFQNLKSIDLYKTETKGYNNLKQFKELNEIYLSDNIDRKYVDFMYENFRDGDMLTTAYFVKKKFKLKG